MKKIVLMVIACFIYHWLLFYYIPGSKLMGVMCNNGEMSAIEANPKKAR